MFAKIAFCKAHHDFRSQNYKNVFQFFGRAKLHEVITKTKGSITKPPIFGRSAPSKVNEHNPAMKTVLRW